MPRKSSASPPGNCKRVHVSPWSTERRTTPFDPETQTTGTGTPFVSVKEETLTPRRFVSSPLVCTLHHCACMETPRNNENRSGKRERIPRILAGDCTKKRCYSSANSNSKRNICFLHSTGLDFRGLPS